jgi:electron-transferring-flavoprotein dehydrogenase
MNMERESIDFDVLFIGGGPANLAGAIALMKLSKEKNLNLEVALIEKGAEIGAHALSGAVLNPAPLRQLIPDFMDKGCPIENVVRGDEFYFLTQNRHFRIPIVPRYMHNQGHFIISLSLFTRWLGQIAEELGVNIFPGFAGVEVLFGPDQKTVIGVRAGDKGLDKDKAPKANFEPGIDLHAKVCVFGEGARGSLTKQLDARLNLSARAMPQVYEIGIKEVIQLPEDNYFSSSRGNDIHTMGYPLGLDVPGGGFIYQMKDNKAAAGYLTALCYEDPTLDPYEMLIRFKRHPLIAKILKNGKVIEQGARTVSTGGHFSIPRLAMDGALLTGGAAAIHNTPALKGIHVSMASGILAAEAIVKAFEEADFTRKSLGRYETLIENSPIHQEIYEGRNFSQALAMKGLKKFIHLGAQYISQGRGIRDELPIEPDSDTLKPVNEPHFARETQHYDGILCVDKLTGVYLSKTRHREDQPSHIVIHSPEVCVNHCFKTFGCPCTRFCPGSVYELAVHPETGKRQLKLNPSNCLHCKTCDIKDPYGNITWTCPEGGDGPGYSLA